ncbi:thiamine phosphate synthase [Chromatium okenii]|uniref:thiamine phosphate synthase n=1 Tax=Chromatium okenii TaxID=61644 RepID=UPI0026EA0FEB|nr:thiamine phosphate synthase [Chromatium okenii]
MPNIAVERQPLHVMVGIIRDANGRVLISQRPPQVAHGGCWEFPGGKVERGETPEQALARELAEELGIQVVSSQPLRVVRHVYPPQTVLLDVRQVTDFVGIPHGREGQPLAWQLPTALDPSVFPAGDRPIINLLRLPPLLQITDGAKSLLFEKSPQPPFAKGGLFSPSFCQRNDFFSSPLWKRGVRGDLSKKDLLLQLRAHDRTDAEYNHLARQLFARCEQHGVRLVLNRAPDCVINVPHHGLHLTSHLLMTLTERPGSATELIGASCHDAAQLAQAERLGLDYALLSPVQKTASHPDATPLGWARFAELVESLALPVYALGGVTPADVPLAQSHGAHGIAGIRGFFGDR